MDCTFHFCGLNVNVATPYLVILASPYLLGAVVAIVELFLLINTMSYLVVSETSGKTTVCEDLPLAPMVLDCIEFEL